MAVNRRYLGGEQPMPPLESIKPELDLKIFDGGKDKKESKVSRHLREAQELVEKKQNRKEKRQADRENTKAGGGLQRKTKDTETTYPKLELVVSPAETLSTNDPEKAVEKPIIKNVELKIPKIEQGKLFLLCQTAKYLEENMQACSARIKTIEDVSLPMAIARKEQNPNDKSLSEAVIKISYEKVKLAEQALESSRKLLPIKAEIFTISKLNYRDTMQWYEQEKNRRGEVATTKKVEEAANAYAQEGIDIDAQNSESQKAIDKEAEEGNYRENTERIQTINQRLSELKPLLEQIKIGWFSKVKVDQNGFITNLPGHTAELLITEMEQKIEKLKAKGKTDEANKLQAEAGYLNECQDLLAERENLAALTGSETDLMTLRNERNSGGSGSITVDGTSIIYKKGKK